MCKRVFLSLIVLVCVVSSVAAQEIVNQKDTLSYGPAIDYVAVMKQLNRASQPTVWQRFSDWFDNKRSVDAIDSHNLVVRGNVGLGYAQETNLMFAASAFGFYSLNPKNKQLPYSSTSLIGAMSVNGSFRLVANSNLILSSYDRLDIYLGGGSMPVKFWGLGYHVAELDVASKYVRGDFRADVEYKRSIVSGLSLGAELDFRYVLADDVQSLALEYLQQAGVQDFSFTTTGLGVVAEWDGRKMSSNLTQGFYLQLRGAMHPKALGSHYDTFWHVEATANYYQPLWMGGELALDMYADAWTWNTPWLFWAKVGGENRMRGYYYGRYTDRKMVTAQVELRQKIYKVLSGAAWMGAGSVFSSYKLFDVDEILPNYGVGIRVAVAENLLLRVDYGFGRHSHGLIINVNEAF